MTNSQVDGPSNLFSEKLIENKYKQNEQQTDKKQKSFSDHVSLVIAASCRRSDFLLWFVFQFVQTSDANVGDATTSFIVIVLKDNHVERKWEWGTFVINLSLFSLTT